VTYEHKPRFGTNYYGLRGAMSILSEAYSHDPFDVRVASTKAFVQEVLSYVAERPREIRSRVRGRARHLDVRCGGRVAGGTGALPLHGARPTRSRCSWRCSSAPDSTQRHEPGMPIGMRRTGR
jgi:hypothetical protein